MNVVANSDNAPKAHNSQLDEQRTTREISALEMNMISGGWHLHIGLDVSGGKGDAPK